MIEAQPPSLEGLRQTLEAVYSAGGLVIGSIGRVAIFGQMRLNPLIELDAREEHLLIKRNGRPRDVDVIGDYGFARQLSRLPHPVDGTAFTTSCILARDEPDRWRYIDFSGQSHDIDPDCFVPVEGDVLGVPCITVRPATHLALVPSHGKHQVAHAILNQHLDEEERSFLESGAYYPFWEPPFTEH